MDKRELLEQEIEKIKARNEKVELDKARETSLARKCTIALLTYIVIVLFFTIAKLGNPFINAIVPTVGFLLSTISFDILKKLRLKQHKVKK